MPSDGPTDALEKDQAAVYGMLGRDRGLLDDIFAYCGRYEEAMRAHEHIERSDLTRRIRDEYGWDQRRAESALHDVLDLGALSSDGSLNAEDVAERARYTRDLRAQLKEAYRDAVAYHASEGRRIPEDVTAGIRVRDADTMIGFDVMACYDPVDGRVRLEEKEAPFRGVEPNSEGTFAWERFSRDTLYRACLVHELTHVYDDRAYAIKGERNEVLDEGLAVYTTLRYCADMAAKGEKDYARFARTYVSRSLELTKGYSTGTRIVAGIAASEGAGAVDEVLRGDTPLEELAAAYEGIGAEALKEQLEALG